MIHAMTFAIKNAKENSSLLSYITNSTTYPHEKKKAGINKRMRS